MVARRWHDDPENNIKQRAASKMADARNENFFMLGMLECLKTAGYSSNSII